jgi:hypothetical protein
MRAQALETQELEKNGNNIGFELFIYGRAMPQ